VNSDNKEPQQPIYSDKGLWQQIWRVHCSSTISLWAIKSLWFKSQCLHVWIGQQIVYYWFW